MFTIKLHHGGRFIKFPGISYIEGKLYHVHLVDMDEFSVHELDEVMLKLGYEVPPVIYYHYQLPNEDLEFGLRALGNDVDVLSLAHYIGHHKIIKLVEGSQSCSKKLCFNLEHTTTVGDQDPHVEIGNEGAAIGDQDTEVHDQGATIGVTLGDQEVNTKVYDTFYDQPFQFEDFDPFFKQYTFNECNDQSMGVGAGLDEVQFKWGSEGSGEDSDFLEDEENYISDVEVDMSDFYMNVDLDVEYVDRGKGVEDTDDEKRKAILKHLVKEKKCSLGEVHAVTFQVGQKYKSKKEIKDQVCKLAIETRRNIGFKKNNKMRLRVVCKGNVPNVNASGVGKGNKVICSWSMQTSRSKDSDYWYVKTLLDKHTCVQTRKLRACTAKYISTKILDMVKYNPTVPIRSIQDEVQKRLQVGVSIHKLQREKATTTKQVTGDYTKQYEVLRCCFMELQTTNVDTTVKLEVVNEPNGARETRQFKSVYVCLGALKKGFKTVLRDILGLDVAFMNGPFPGQVLTAVGLDSNNGIYPLAYAIVETENLSSWKWFLECLGDDLELYSNSNFTFMSDRQKGLLPAIAQLYPQVEHQFCLRHINENMRKKIENKRDAFEWLKRISPHHWATSHFSGRAGSNILLNNLCEVFNSKLIHGSDKPIISCLDYIKQYLMKRIYNVMKVMSKAPCPLTPTTSKLLEINMEASVHYRARGNGTTKYEHVVDMTNMSYTYKRWELNGIPCRHAITTIHDMADSGDKVRELYTYVNKVYRLQTWKEAYSYNVDPIKGRSMWPKSTCPMKLTPPPHHIQPGKLKTTRKRSAYEKYDNQKHKHGASEPENLPESLLMSGKKPPTRKLRTQSGKNMKLMKVEDGRVR
uniref:SWIM-type domain-containing protein n=1 Tax=Lactuca sativa TaxID=4236 RepID=A0A9R1WVS6_LACSA|nr:hypothetical protein LSAT_V11C900465720 [Lactuca sativa]